MKFVLNLTFAVIFTTGACIANESTEDESSINPVITPKEQIRIDLLTKLEVFLEGGIQPICRRLLPPEEITLADNKIGKFVACANATIDKLDENVNFDDVDKMSQQFCGIFDDLFRCVGEINPVIDVCLTEREIILKNKVFALVPLIQQTICLRNGALITEIVQHNDTQRCTSRIPEIMFSIGLTDIFYSDSTELFGDQTVCQQLNDVLNQVYRNVGECSVDVLERVKDMLGFFCEGTHCERYVHDLQCY